MWKEANQGHDRNIHNEIPKFNLINAKRQFGNGTTKVETNVLAIKSSADDAAYLKALFSSAYEEGHIIIGQFVPTGFHLTTDG
eukprot:8557568-Ditylum_brightwellii.AAC.1